MTPVQTAAVSLQDRTDMTSVWVMTWDRRTSAVTLHGPFVDEPAGLEFAHEFDCPRNVILTGGQPQVAYDTPAGTMARDAGEAA